LLRILNAILCVDVFLQLESEQQDQQQQQQQPPASNADSPAFMF
jgi:hypothetical protein